MISKHNPQHSHEGGPPRSRQSNAEQARSSSPARQAARGEPSHQKDMHDQRMSDQHTAERRNHGRKH
ncbi:hypothetical protein [Stenotrophomonas sp.]|uniref:hypothetical protein n=1 Tax=Stenotrophomonas sp. TaxID=69392 RepID=UPI0028AC19F4|nr:hypothetical protein [Stenotrophomonas sp.]